MLRLTITLLFFATMAAADDSVFVNTDIFELEVAADPRISPDGSRIAYVRQSMDIMTDTPVSNIWIIDSEGDNHRPLLSGARSYSSPRWSPSGDRLAYVSKVFGRGAQLHVRWMDTGQTAVLSNVRRSPTSLTWSPDGTRIAFEMFVEDEKSALASPPAAPDGTCALSTSVTALNSDPQNSATESGATGFEVTGNGEVDEKSRLLRL